MMKNVTKLKNNRAVLGLRRTLLLCAAFALVAVSLVLCIRFAFDYAMEYYIPGAIIKAATPLEKTEDEKDLFINEDGQMKISTDQYTAFPPILWDYKFAKLTFESVGLTDEPVYNGDSDDQLRKGLAHYAGSRFPGQGGNVVILGHRKTYRIFGDAQIGDEVTLETFYGTYKYKVSDIQILPKKDISLVDADDTKEVLTLYTCYPFDSIGYFPQRYYVICDYVSGPQWVNGEGFVIYTTPEVAE